MMHSVAGFSLIESLTRQECSRNCGTFSLRAIQATPYAFILLFFLAATHLSGASRWGMMRAGACSTGLYSFLIGVHLGSPAEMNAATRPQSQRHFSPPSSYSFPPPCPATAPIPLRVFTEGGGWSSNELSAALTDCGHFNNLAFFKSPLQSAKKSFPSQFITSCLPWTCLVYTNYVFQGRGRLIGLYTSTIISMKY